MHSSVTYFSTRRWSENSPAQVSRLCGSINVLTALMLRAVLRRHRPDSETRSHFKTRLWTNLDREMKGFDSATEGFETTCSRPIPNRLARVIQSNPRRNVLQYSMCRLSQPVEIRMFGRARLLPSRDLRQTRLSGNFFLPLFTRLTATVSSTCRATLLRVGWMGWVFQHNSL